MEQFDTTIIGAGPCAFGALLGLDPQSNLCVISGEEHPYTGSLKRLHPKIRMVSTESNENPGIANPFLLTHGSKRALLFNTSKIGGLARYWGQSFIAYQPHHPWPKTLFNSYDAYINAVQNVEQHFKKTERHRIQRDSLPRDLGIDIRAASLMTGTVEAPDVGLLATGHIMRTECKRRGVDLRSGRVVRITPQGKKWCLHLQSGHIIQTQKLIIAAGAIGTGELLLKSFSDIKRIRIHDHTPWMLYSYGIERLLQKYWLKKATHFNIATLENKDEKHNDFFASVYDISKAKLNLLTSVFAGFTSPLLKGIPAPFGSGLIKPIQLWTTQTYGAFDLSFNGSAVQAVAVPSVTHDPILTTFKSQLKKQGVYILKTTSTPAGLGYHYHNMHLDIGETKTWHVNQFLAQQGNNLICVDGSALEHAGVRPHTLTAMTAASALSRSI